MDIPKNINISEDQSEYFIDFCKKGYINEIKNINLENITKEVKNYAIILVIQNGHLEVVKYLFSQVVADVTEENNEAVRDASLNGHLEVVKYLVSQGADITAEDNYAIKWTSENGHLELVKYLNRIANITINNN